MLQITRTKHYEVPQIVILEEITGIVVNPECVGWPEQERTLNVADIVYVWEEGDATLVLFSKGYMIEVDRKVLKARQQIPSC